MTWSETWRRQRTRVASSGGSVKKIKGVSFLFFTILCTRQTYQIFDTSKESFAFPFWITQYQLSSNCICHSFNYGLLYTVKTNTEFLVFYSQHNGMPLFVHFIKLRAIGNKYKFAVQSNLNKRGKVNTFNMFRKYTVRD